MYQLLLYTCLEQISYILWSI